MNPKSQLLKQPVDKRYFNREETLKLLETVPVPAEEDNIEPKKPIYPPTESIKLDDKIVNIDLVPVTKRNKPLTANHEDWIKKFNRQKKVMISMPDLYLAGKLGSSELLENLQSDFRQNCITTSTIIHYKGQNLDAEIIHYFAQDKLIQPIKQDIKIPDLCNDEKGIYLNSVLFTDDGLKFLQALFETTDSANQIINTLESLSGFSGCTKVVTSHMDNRYDMMRVAGFGYDDNSVYIFNNRPLAFYGRSRAVYIINSNNGGAK